MVIGVSFGEIEPVLLLFALEIPLLISCSMYLLWRFPATATLHSRSRDTRSVYITIPFQIVDASPSASFPIN